MQVELKQADVVAWLRFLLFHAPGSRLRLMTRLLLPAVGVAMLIGIGLVLRGGSPFGALLGGAFALVLGLASEGWRWLTLSQQARRLCQAQPDLLRPRTYTCRPEGLVVEDQAGCHVLAWTGFVALLEADQHLFLMRSAETALILPRASFSTPTASQQFLACCHEHAGISSATDRRA